MSKITVTYYKEERMFHPPVIRQLESYLLDASLRGLSLVMWTTVGEGRFQLLFEKSGGISMSRQYNSNESCKYARGDNELVAVAPWQIFVPVPSTKTVPPKAGDMCFTARIPGDYFDTFAVGDSVMTVSAINMLPIVMSELVEMRRLRISDVPDTLFKLPTTANGHIDRAGFKRLLNSYYGEEFDDSVVVTLFIMRSCGLPNDIDQEAL